MGRLFCLVIYLCIPILGACSKKSAMTETRWSGGGQPPPLPSEGLSANAEWSSAKERVQLGQQSIHGFIVEDSFFKTVKAGNKLVFQSTALLETTPEKILLEAKNLDSNKERSFAQFLKKNSEYAKWKIELSPRVIIATRSKIRPILSAYLSSSAGQIFEIQFNKDGNIKRANQLGSTFADMESSALVFPLGPRKSELSKVLLHHMSRTEGLANSHVWVQTNSPYRILPSQSLELQPSDERFDQVQAYYYANQMIEWLDKKSLVKGPLEFSIVTNMGYPEKTNTAFYFQGQIRLGVGDDVIYSKIPQDPSIVIHEVAHVVIDALARLPFQGEGGSINEGFADALTTFYLDNPLLGENAYKKAPYKRSVAVSMKLSERNQGLYHDSAIVSSFFWHLKSQIGVDKALSLMIRVLNRLGPNTNFSNFVLTLKEQVNETLKGEDLVKANIIMKERELL